jgi:hypothetical protein
MQRFIQRKFDADFEINDFIHSDYSQMRCYHSPDWARRWCEVRNWIYGDHHFFFLSPARFQFLEPFIVPGARAPPFDRDCDRLGTDSIILDRKIKKLPWNLSVIDDLCYISGVFHNGHMLWHTIFDFVIPLYNFIRLLNGTDTPSNRRIYVSSEGIWNYELLMRIFSDLPIFCWIRRVWWRLCRASSWELRNWKRTPIQNEIAISP